MRSTALSRHPRRIAALLLLLWLSTACVPQWQCARAEIIDQFPGIQNAFATATGAAVRAVYDASQLTQRSASDTELSSFQSRSYVLCNAVPSSTGAAAVTGGLTATATTDIVAAWCNTHHSGRLVSQKVNWSTLTAPGLQPLDKSNTYRARAWDCITYTCDMENFVSTTTSASVAPAAVGGLSVGTPCCGSTNSTFVIYNSRGLVVQADVLPVTELNNEALLLAEAYTAAQACSILSSSNAESVPTVSLRNAMDYCLLRQLPSWMYGNSVEGADGDVGDGGIVLPVDVAICNEDLSDRIDTRSASLAVRGYNLLLVTADGVDELSFPKELIEGIASWVAHSPGVAFGSYGAHESLRRKQGACAWRNNPSYATAYRTGDYYACTLSDATLLQHLPPLLLSVRNDSIVNTEETSSSCTVAIDLAACATSNGEELHFFSSGSLMHELRLQQDAMTNFTDPPIVVGLQHLRGSTMAVTRQAHIRKWASSNKFLAAGFPLLYLATPRGTAMGNCTSSPSRYACVRPQTCAKHHMFFTSLNRCAAKECVNVFLYHFDPETFECSVQVSIASLFAAMCVALLIAEATVLYLRRSTEQAKDEHMRLVHAVQRTAAEAQ
ncbi:hypothetical protein ABL78_6086 [Leptomonas seymouri]|uniref:Uncharacterized protein n=1 Tax=Leptomonas seymouri TaxID=5684 RepID=A0A0N1I3W1_LEPSE|nr:hypothetical protein ABL78_6086 [Leptomonas seymouri]|eukprot:KPI84858.1 hypothetical protein ABL78_6086 [Leptomonas seymouri]